MSSENISKKQQKYQDRLRRSKRNKRKKQAVNITLITVGFGIILLALYLPSLQPITDLVEPTQRAHPLADGNALGDPNAPVTIEVYSDFKCPACEYFFEAIEPQIIQQYVETGLVYFIYHTFGDRINPPQSGITAQALYCAEDQGNFWEMHDYIYSNFDYGVSKGFTVKAMEKMAELIGLDTNVFSSCLADNTHTDKLDQDVENGTAEGIPGTPSVILNGNLLDSFHFADIQAAIENILSDVEGEE